MSAFIGVDWGTTNLRAWRLNEGEIEQRLELPTGVSALPRAEIEAFFDQRIHQPLGRWLPVLMCGMVGANIGWRPVDYVDCPAEAHSIAGRIGSVRESPAVRIVPGLRCPGLTGAPDIMRGEETQIIGWIASAAAHERGCHVLCLPGTHSKWALVRDGAIERFVTAMTGELFQVLSEHSILAADANIFDGDAFLAGVAAAGDGDALSVRLFSARARTVAAGADARHGAAYLSGLLIGSEIAAISRTLDIGAEGPVTLIGSPLLRDRYHRACARRGWKTREMDGAEAAIAGLTALVREGALL